MSAEPFYKQVELRREGTFLVSWIPEVYAHVGYTIGLKDKGQWSEGWEVLAVGAKRLPESAMVERSQDYKRTRKASDI